jgi:hypothetical protein
VNEIPSLDLFAEDLGSSLEVESLDESSLLGTWSTTSSWTSTSCPVSSASTLGTASSTG